ncbi:MAG: S24/S26 family peptidase [Acutalibacteraceae bacterium]|nr:S24/S26 family peptidase [Acutalibacteraceae bacterium]
MTEKTKKVCSAEELLPILEDVIKNSGTFPLTITGTSMTPLLYNIRDSVNLISPKSKPPKKYDIVFFQRKNGKLVLHRIIKVLPDNKLLINGDSQMWTETINNNQIIAVVKSYKRKGKLTDCNSFSFKLYSILWCSLKPFRPFIFKISKCIKKIFKRK